MELTLRVVSVQVAQVSAPSVSVDALGSFSEVEAERAPGPVQEQLSRPEPGPGAALLSAPPHCGFRGVPTPCVFLQLKGRPSVWQPHQGDWADWNSDEGSDC